MNVKNEFFNSWNSYLLEVSAVLLLSTNVLGFMRQHWFNFCCIRSLFSTILLMDMQGSAVPCATPKLGPRVKGPPVFAPSSEGVIFHCWLIRAHLVCRSWILCKLKWSTNQKVYLPPENNDHVYYPVVWALVWETAFFWLLVGSVSVWYRDAELESNHLKAVPWNHFDSCMFSWRILLLTWATITDFWWTLTVSTLLSNSCDEWIWVCNSGRCVKCLWTELQLDSVSQERLQGQLNTSHWCTSPRRPTRRQKRLPGSSCRG